MSKIPRPHRKELRAKRSFLRPPGRGILPGAARGCAAGRRWGAARWSGRSAARRSRREHRLPAAFFHAASVFLRAELLADGDFASAQTTFEAAIALGFARRSVLE